MKTRTQSDLAKRLTRFIDTGYRLPSSRFTEWVRRGQRSRRWQNRCQERRCTRGRQRVQRERRQRYRRRAQRWRNRRPQECCSLRMRDGDGQWVQRFWGGYESGRRITHTRLAEAVCKGAGVDERGRSEGESENWGEEAHAGYDSEYLWGLGGLMQPQVFMHE